MTRSEFRFRSDSDGLSIRAYKWRPDARPRAVVQIAHGLAEHGARYGRFAGALNARGYAVYATDHRGHGGSLPESGRLGDIGSGGWAGLVSDVAQLGALAREENRGLPLVLFGHSMGSFAVQDFLLDRSALVDAAIMSGSSDLPSLAQALSAGADVSFGSFNAAFEPARTAFDWLSRDEAEVDAYVADPQCGFDAPDFAAQMFPLAARLADTNDLQRVRPNLPLLIFGGDRDPVGGAGALLNMLSGRYRAAGLRDVTLKLYSEGRHEMLNEINRDEVTADIADWLEARAGR